MLPDPFWLMNVDITPQLMMSYQIRIPKKPDILKRDMMKLKAITQPKLVREQLSQLYAEMEDHGEVINPLLEQDATSTNLSSTTGTSSSSGEENEPRSIRKRTQKQVTFERYAIIYGEDAPMPPAVPGSVKIQGKP